MNVELSDEAKAQARRERAWWRTNRDARDLFSQELRAARLLLKEGPRHEVYGFFEGEPVRRLLLEKTQCHVYYIVLEPENLVRIVAIWGASRGTDPEFGRSTGTPSG